MHLRNRGVNNLTAINKHKAVLFRPSTMHEKQFKSFREHYVKFANFMKSYSHKRRLTIKSKKNLLGMRLRLKATRG